MSDALFVKAHGKINLALSITGIRADGYHTIKTVMQSISIYNELKIERSDFLTLCCDDKALFTDMRNTAYRAAEFFYTATEIKERVALTLSKKIPYQAGLGSASCDAAAVLCGLNNLYDYPLTEKELLKLGERVGADVPFSMMGGTILCEGIGEVMTPLSPMPECFIVLVFPNLMMSTVEAYGMIDALSHYRTIDFIALAKGLLNKDLAGIAQLCDNDFAVVCHPLKTKEIKEKLLSLGAIGASLSGSGTAVFGIFTEHSSALNAVSCFEQSLVCTPYGKAIEIIKN